MPKYGPIESVQEKGNVPGSSSGKDADTSCVYNGVPGFPKGTPGKVDQVTFVTEGVFGKVERATRKGE